jgi:2-oxoisovalerate dehydrogenase E1 component alpha subunit
MIVTNNGWGISTSACSQHGEHHIIDRGKAFGIPGEVVDGNDPVASWHAIRRAMAYCRIERRPFMLEATVSRLYGHSSSSGALRLKDESDCIELFEEKLLGAGVLDRETVERTHEDALLEAESALEQSLEEPQPSPEDIHRHSYAPSPVDHVYPGDYTGLPE